MTYSSTIEEVNSTRRKFKISVPASSIQSTFQAVALEIQKTAEVRGFRKGKAPATLIRKFFMNDILKKAADRVINDAYSEVSKTADFQIVSYPHIEPDNQFDENKEFQFSATVDINPKVEIKDYNNLSVKLNENLKIDLEAECDKFLNSYAKAVTKPVLDTSDRALVKGDVANVSYKVFLEGKELEGKEVINQNIELNGANIQAVEDSLFGMKAKENKVFSVTLPETFRDEELKGKTVEFHLTLNSVSTLELPSFDDELAKKLGQESIEKVRENLRKSIQKYNDDARVQAAFDQVVEQILSRNSFDVAESLIESTVDKMIADQNTRLAKDQQINPEEEVSRQKYRDLANSQVRGVLALGHIARQESITVSDEEMYQNLSEYASANRMDPRQLVQKGGKQLIDEFRGQVMVHKVVAKLLETAEVTYVASESEVQA